VVEQRPELLLGQRLRVLVLVLLVDVVQRSAPPPPGSSG
jgi:hypothetical protein